MQRSKKILAILAVFVLATSSLFAANSGLRTTTKNLIVGEVSGDELVYDIDIEWGNLEFDFSNKKGELEYGEYRWDTSSGHTIKVTNRSTIGVKAVATFKSVIDGVTCDITSQDTSESYTLLTEEPSDFSTSYFTYYSKEPDRNLFNKLDIGRGNVPFEENKYYKQTNSEVLSESSDLIKGVVVDNGTTTINEKMFYLALKGGSVSDVTPGAVIGTITVALS